MRLHPRILQMSADFQAPLGHADEYHATVHVHLLKGERRALVDTGLAEHPTTDFAPYLEYFGLRLADVDLILNTHGHGDHSWGNAAVKAASGAEARMHEDDVPMVETPGWAFDDFTAPQLRLMGRDEGRVEAARVAAIERMGIPQKIDRALQDGELIELGRGVTLRAVHLPGHTAGSMGFFWEQEGWLFTGDSLQGQGLTPGELPIVSRPASYGATLRKVIQMPLRTLVLGHFFQALSVSANNVKKGFELRRFLSDSLEVHHRIGEAVGRATHRHWGEPFPRVLAAALDGIGTHLHLRLDPNTAAPRSQGASTVAAYYRDLVGR